MEVSPAFISNVRTSSYRLYGIPAPAAGAVYPVVDFDSVPLKVRQEGRVVTKAAYMMVGITWPGYQNVFGMRIGTHDAAKYRLTVLTELKGRSQDILVVDFSHITGLSEVIASALPNADIRPVSSKYVAQKDYGRGDKPLEAPR